MSNLPEPLPPSDPLSLPSPPVETDQSPPELPQKIPSPEVQVTRQMDALVQRTRDLSEECLDTLVNIMRGKPIEGEVVTKTGDVVKVQIAVPHKLRMDASVMILNRAWGTPRQSVEVVHDTPASARAATMEERIRKLRKQANLSAVEIQVEEIGL